MFSMQIATERNIYRKQDFHMKHVNFPCIHNGDGLVVIKVEQYFKTTSAERQGHATKYSNPISGRLRARSAPGTARQFHQNGIVRGERWCLTLLPRTPQCSCRPVYKYLLLSCFRGAFHTHLASNESFLIWFSPKNTLLGF